jgi:hypothetical protein
MLKFRTLLTVFAVVAVADGMLAIWAHPASHGTSLFVQGWGACLIALSVAAWAGRSITDVVAKQWLAISLFSYNLVVSMAWLLDALARGWTLLSMTTFVTLVPMSVAFAYFAFSSRLKPIKIAARNRRL